MHCQALAVLVQQLHSLSAPVCCVRSFPVTPWTQVYNQIILLGQIPIRSTKNMVPLHFTGGTA